MAVPLFLDPALSLDIVTASVPSEAYDTVLAAQLTWATTLAGTHLRAGRRVAALGATSEAALSALRAAKRRQQRAPTRR